MTATAKTTATRQQQSGGGGDRQRGHIFIGGSQYSGDGYIRRHQQSPHCLQRRKAKAKTKSERRKAKDEKQRRETVA
jgi:hypothetical protein